MRWILLLLCFALGCRSAGRTPEPMPAPPPASQSLDDTLKNIDWSVRPLKTPRDSTGTLTLQFENDTFSDESDNNFTAGFGFAWTSAAVDTLSPKNWFRNRIEDEFSFFPTVSNPNYRNFVQLSLNYEMYTANDISDPDPPPGDHPYSGIIAFDTAVYSKSERSMHVYVLRVGLVGPAVGAEGLQNWMHSSTGRELAQGWDTQLSNEPLLNLFYIYQRRLVRWTVSERGLGFDMAVNGGVGAGNYYTGANIGLQARFGIALPNNYEHSSPVSFYEEVVDRRTVGGPFSFYVYVQGTGTAVARFLPIDGNTFADSRSGDRDDFFSNVAIGAALTYKRFTLTFRTNFVGTALQVRQNDDDYSVVTASWVF